VETALLAALAGTAKNRGAQSLIGEFIPTQKNQPSAHFLKQHGFTLSEDVESCWHLPLNQVLSIPEHFKHTGL
jgi:predicted enzyme involved in methoxymalonyl-ACP biosynthesis